MAHDTIPPPTENDIEMAERLVELVRTDPDRAIRVMAQQRSETRWLRNMTHPESGQES